RLHGPWARPARDEGHRDGALTCSHGPSHGPAPLRGGGMHPTIAAAGAPARGVAEKGATLHEQEHAAHRRHVLRSMARDGPGARPNYRSPLRQQLTPALRGLAYIPTAPGATAVGTPPVRPPGRMQPAEAGGGRYGDVEPFTALWRLRLRRLSPRILPVRA